MWNFKYQRNHWPESKAKPCNIIISRKDVEVIKKAINPNQSIWLPGDSEVKRQRWCNHTGENKLVWPLSRHRGNTRYETAQQDIVGNNRHLKSGNLAWPMRSFQKNNNEFYQEINLQRSFRWFRCSHNLLKTNLLQICWFYDCWNYVS